MPDLHKCRPFSLHLRSASKIWAERHDLAWLCGIGLFALVYSFDLFSDSFSWMAFQERDFSRAADFVRSGRLSHVGPEASGGGFIPGPGLTLIYAPLVWLFQSPRAIHVMLQLSYLLSAFLTFHLVRKHFDRPAAFLSLGLIVTAPNYIYYAYAGWHASLVLPIIVVSIYLYDRYHSRSHRRVALLSGLVLGLGMQTHPSVGLIYLGHMVFLALFHRRNLLRFFLCSALAIIATFTYYIFIEYREGFENSRELLFRTDDQGAFVFPLFPRNWMNFWASYRRFVPYAGGYAYSGGIVSDALSIALVTTGLGLLLTRKEYRRTAAYCPYLLLLLLLPVLFGRSHARFFLIAHPAFEILLAISILAVYRSLKKPRYAAGAFAAILSVVGLYHIVVSARWEESYIASHTIYYRPYSRFDQVTNVVLHNLRLTPREYEERFYMFRGDWIWPFWTTHPLPSQAHYTLLYEVADLARRGAPSLLDGLNAGVLLVEERFDSSVNLSKLDVIDKHAFGKFTAYIYRGPYFYRQAKQYNEPMLGEEEVHRWTGEAYRVKKDLGSLQVKGVIEVPARNAFRYMQSAYIEESGEGLLGFTEITSADLRQWRFGELSPYFVLNPSIRFTFQDGTSHDILVAQDNLYSDSRATGWSYVYAQFGQLTDAGHIGTLYPEAPFGVSFSLPRRRISDIMSISFQHEGYGSIVPADRSAAGNSLTIAL